MQKEKKKRRIITDSKDMDLCRELLNTMDILPVYSQYIF
jgi:hypothetical protein